VFDQTSQENPSTSDRTLTNLRRCAFSLFGRYGYEGVSVGDIAKQANLSKGALYWHYSGKEALYLDCLGLLHEIFREDIFLPMSLGATGMDGIMAMFDGILRLFTDPRVQDGIAGFWIIPDTPETLSLVQAQQSFQAQCRAVIEATLRRAIEERSLDVPDDVPQLSHAVMSLVEACLLPMRRLSAEELRAQLTTMARILLRAYATRTPAP
jgi:AcrR family transcriptional regulator